MDFNEIFSSLEEALYAYDLKSFSEFFIVLIDNIEHSYSIADSLERKRLEPIIESIFTAYQKKDYRLALEIAKYEIKNNDEVLQ